MATRKKKKFMKRTKNLLEETSKQAEAISSEQQISHCLASLHGGSSGHIETLGDVEPNRKTTDWPKWHRFLTISLTGGESCNISASLCSILSLSGFITSWYFFSFQNGGSLSIKKKKCLYPLIKGVNMGSVYNRVWHIGNVTWKFVTFIITKILSLNTSPDIWVS